MSKCILSFIMDCNDYKVDCHGSNEPRNDSKPVVTLTRHCERSEAIQKKTKMERHQN